LPVPTALAEAQERLRRSEELYRYIVELSSLVPWISDDHGNVLSGGPRWTEWTGAPIEAARGQGWFSFVHPDCQKTVQAQWSHSLRTGERLDLEYRLRWADGVYRWCHARATKREDGDGESGRWFGTLEDVHDQRIAEEASHEAQAELVHVSRLSAMGAMASVIAHDLNQPLTAAAGYIRGCKQLLPRDAVERPEVMEALNEADRSIVRAGEIVRRVREFVSRGTVECQPEPLVPMIEEACDLALPDAAMRGITHRLERGSECMVMVDRVQIQQVMVNILRNAVEALKDQPRREIVIGTGAGKSGFCEVTVCDTGPGPAPEAADRMFDPFYTTRKDGTGLGLSISRMIIEAHGGAIWHEARAGEGTVIKFTLPLVPSDHYERASS
jgi:two-component system sensor kinase FixL